MSVPGGLQDPADVFEDTMGVPRHALLDERQPGGLRPLALKPGMPWEGHGDLRKKMEKLIGTEKIGKKWNTYKVMPQFGIAKLV